MESKKEFKPYVPASRITPELTVTSIIMGIILAVVFGAANAYLGLRVGMTVSASIPAAVISMGVIRVILRKNSVLESRLLALQVNHLQQVLFSLYLPFLSGLKKGLWTNQVF